MSDEIYNLIIDHFKTNKEVDSDGLYVISALATCISNKFHKYLESFWPYLTYAFQKVNDHELFKTSIGTLADVARACESNFENKLDIMKSLL